MDPKRDGFVRNEEDKRSKQPFSLVQAFRCAGAGLAATWRSQRNLKIQLAFALVAVILGFAFAIEPWQWLVVVVCIALVLAAECLNTAIEAIVDLVSPGYSNLARIAKDSAAAAVLVCTCASLIAGVVIFGGAILEAVGLVF